MTQFVLYYCSRCKDNKRAYGCTLDWPLLFQEDMIFFTKHGLRAAA